jgi:hypothetical protein
LTTVQAATSIINLTGALTANINLIVPTATGKWLIANNTTGAFTVTVKTAAGTGVKVTQGIANQYYCDGTNVSNIILGMFTSSLGGNGWKKYPDASSPTGYFIEQWGIATGTTGNLAASYPIPFPNATLQGVATLADKTAGAYSGISLYLTGSNFINQSTITITVYGSDGSGTTTARYFVKGY